MNRKKRLAGVGMAFLAVLGGILFPVLVWIALGAALGQKMRGGRTNRALSPAPCPPSHPTKVSVNGVVIDLEEE